MFELFKKINFRETNLKSYFLFYNHTIIIFINLRFESFNDKYLKIPYSDFVKRTLNSCIIGGMNRALLTIVNGLVRRALLRTLCLELFREENGARYFEEI